MKISEGLQLVLFSVGGYWLSYLYQIGYNNYFNIPVDWVSLSLAQAMFAAAVLINSLFLLGMYADILRIPIARHVPKKHQAGTWAIIIYSIIFVVFTVTGKFSWLKVALYVMLLLLMVLQVFFPIEQKTEIERAQSKKSIEIFMNHIPDKSARCLFVPVFMLSLAALALGSAVAWGKDVFLVLKTGTELVVLKQLDDSLVVAKFDRQHQTVFPEFQLIPLSSKSTSLKYEKLGRLTPTDIE